MIMQLWYYESVITCKINYISLKGFLQEECTCSILIALYRSDNETYFRLVCGQQKLLFQYADYVDILAVRPCFKIF